MTTNRTMFSWGLIWSLVIMLVILLEGIALGRPEQDDTLSEAVRNLVRFHPIGIFVLCPIWFWLTWHWILRPQSVEGFTWRDLVALFVGLVYAYFARPR